MKKLLPLFITLSFLQIQAQSLGEVQAKMDSFQAWASEKYEVKEMNIAEPVWGALNNSDPDYHLYFQFKSREKTEDNLGRKGYAKMDVAFYYYNDEEDATYALDAWLKEFMEGKTVRIGRPVRTYEYAKPTIVLMDEKYIAILQMKCSDYFQEDFDEWVRSMEKQLGDFSTMTIELLCEGPLNWTKNAPDPKAKKK